MADREEQPPDQRQVCGSSRRRRVRTQIDRSIREVPANATY
jgi:hypothetical protein